MKDTNRIMERVRKMLALANSTSFPEEAATALRMVEKLLAKHNLSMAEVKVHTDKQDNGNTSGGGKVGETDFVNRNGRPWMRRMYYHCAHLYGCEYLYQRRWGGKTAQIFIGKPHNIAVAKEMGDYLIKSIRRLSRAAKRQQLDEFGFVPEKFVTSFSVGAASEVGHRISKLIKERKGASEAEPAKGKADESTALAVVMTNELQQARDFMDKNIATVKKNSRQTSVNHSAYSQGIAAGKGIGLNTQIR